jgi:MFS family permease
MIAAACPAPSSLRSRARHVDHINLATALLRSGFMPFLALFLHERGLGTAAIGAVMAFGSMVGLAATVPVGMLVDHARSRSRWLIGAGALALGAPLLLLQAHGMAALLCAVAMMSLSEAVIAPALLAMNVHDVPPGALIEQLGRNQAFGHIGRVAGLTLSGMIGNHFGFATLIAFEALYLVGLLLLVWRTPFTSEAPRARRVAASGTSGLSLLLLGVTLGLFQIGNAALPTLLGISIIDTTRISAPLLASGSTIIAQVAMIVGSLLAIPALRRWGYWGVLAGSFAILPLRCALAALLPGTVALLPVEMLHGLGEAAQMVAIAGAVGGPLPMRGRIGTRFGCVMLLQGLGTAASPLIGGYVAERWTDSVAYLLLGAIGLLALAFWILCRQQLTRFAGVPRFGLA